jgi:hypothetical protein
MSHKNIPKIRIKPPILKFISNKEFDEIESKAIPFGEWHFEKCDRGVKPVKGKYEPDNPEHVKYEDVIGR